MDELAAVLEGCIVQLWQGDTFQGTGFFVASRQILTCAHVVEPRLGPVRVSWQGENYSATTLSRIPPESRNPHFYELPDVALLELTEPVDHPSVVLGDRVQGSLRSAGYVLGSELPRPGVDAAMPCIHSVMVAFVGPSGDAQRIAGDHLPKGMSGSPVVDEESRKVVGLLKAARTGVNGPSGWFVGVRSLRDYLPDLLRDNMSSHADGSSRWLRFSSRRDYWQQMLFAAAPAMTIPISASGTVPPSWYLVPDNAVVPYLPPETFHQISYWCRDVGSSQATVWLIHAPGGAGKTRLAQELSRALFSDGWVAGVYDSGEGMRRAIVSCRGALNDGNRVFIAVDYAETHVAGITELFYEIRSSPADRLRIVLLARSTGPWWTSFLGSAQSDLLVDRTPVTLAVSPGDPAAEYDRAGRAFAKAIGGSEEWASEAPVHQTTSQARSMLEVHASALDTVIGQGPSKEASPLEGVLRHERRYWSRICSVHAGHRFPPGDPLADRLLVLPSLLHAPTLSAAISAVTQFTGSYRDIARPDLIARALAAAYPNGTGGWGSLNPDRLAETLFGDVLLAYCDRQEMARDLKAMWQDLPAEQLQAGLTVLVRLCEDSGVNTDGFRREAAGRALDVCFAELPDTAPGALLLAAAGLSNPGSVLARLFSAANDFDLSAVQGAIRHLPENFEMSAPFVQLATALLQRRLDFARQTEYRIDPGLTAELIDSLTELAGVLKHGGRDEEAIKYALEALHVIDTLPRPAVKERLPTQEASAHNVLGNCLAGLGKYSEAVQHFRTSVLISRRLVETGSPAARVGFGIALTNLSTFLAEAGERELALSVAEQAVVVRRQLAGDDHDRYAAALARALNALASRLTTLGHASKALGATTEAYQLMTGLASRSFSANCHDLAEACLHHSEALASVRRLDEALERAEQGLEIRRLLHSRNPDKYAHDLAITLLNTGRLRCSFHAPSDTLSPFHESYQLLQSLARKVPSAYLSDYAVAASEFAGALQANGLHEDAVAISHEAVTISEKLAEDGSHTAALRYAAALNTRAEALLAAGQRLEARRVGKRAADATSAFMEQLLVEHPSELANLLNAHRQLLFDMEDYEGAVEAGDRLLAALEQMAIRDPAGSAPRLAEAFIAHAVAVRILGDQRLAADLCLRAAEVIDINVSPEHAVLKAHALSNAAVLLVAMCEFVTAVGYAKYSVQILQDETRGDHPRHRQELAYALNQLGLALSEAGDVGEALGASEESVAVYRTLTPFTRAEDWCAFAGALRNLGADLMTAQQFAKAADVTKESIAIMESIQHYQPLRTKAELVGALKNLEHQFRALGNQHLATEAAFRRGSYERELKSAGVTLGEVANSE